MTVPLWSGAFRAAYAPVDLNVGSAIKVNEPRLGLNEVVCRITEIEEGDTKDGTVLIRFVQDKFALNGVAAEVLLGDEDDVTGTADKTAAAPELTFVAELPYYQGVRTVGQENFDEVLTSDPDVGYVMGTASKPNDFHIGATLVQQNADETWTALTDTALCPYGVLSQGMTAAADDTTLIFAYNETRATRRTSRFCPTRAPAESERARSAITPSRSTPGRSGHIPSGSFKSTEATRRPRCRYTTRSR